MRVATAYRAHLLNSRNVYLRPLGGVLGGELDWSGYRAVQGGGSLVLHGSLDDVDTLRDRVQITYHSEVTEGETPRESTAVSVGVYLISQVTRTVTRLGEEAHELMLLDTTTVLAEDAVPNGTSFAAGALATDALRDVVASVGEQVAITDSTETLRTALAWPAGTTRLSIANELADAVGYWAVRSDERGVLRVEPYILPADRPVRTDYRDAEAHVLSAPRTYTVDLHAIPNRVVLTSRGDDETEALTGVAENTSPSSRVSYAARGDRWVTAPVEDVDATSQAVIDALAARRLADLSRVVERVTIAHLYDPAAVAMHSAVISPDGEHCTIAARKLDLSPRPTLVETTLRRTTEV